MKETLRVNIPIFWRSWHQSWSNLSRALHYLPSYFLTYHYDQPPCHWRHTRSFPEVPHNAHLIPAVPLNLTIKRRLWYLDHCFILKDGVSVACDTYWQEPSYFVPSSVCITILIITSVLEKTTNDDFRFVETTPQTGKFFSVSTYRWSVFTFRTRTM